VTGLMEKSFISPTQTDIFLRFWNKRNQFIMLLLPHKSTAFSLTVLLL
jgi:hypothetical protein